MDSVAGAGRDGLWTHQGQLSLLIGLSMGLRGGVPRVYCVFSIYRAEEKEQRHG
jgi:hypothetical protein